MEKTSQFPDRVSILITSHRSGSTWLSDAIRCHPAVEYYPTPVVYEKLGLSGRRYPGDLSNRVDCTYELEVQSGKREKIPQFDLLPDLPKSLHELEFVPYGLEKCHPSFFRLEPELLLQKIADLENMGIQVKLVYLVRDPQSLISSFLNYQQRKPSWYKNLTGAELVDFITDTFKCIEIVAQKRSQSAVSPLIFDYANLKTDLPQVLRKIYQELWSEPNDLQLQYLKDVSNLAQRYTARQSRVTQTHSPFLGQKEGAIRGGSQHKNFFNTHQESVKRCYTQYQSVIDRATIKL